MTWTLIPRRRHELSARVGDPFALLEQHMQRFFQDPHVGLSTSAPAVERALGARFDLRETAEELILNAELPGVAEEDIQLSITGDVLTLRAEKKSETREEKDTWYLEERSFGSFERAVRLPVEVEADRAEATFERGVLNLRIPKSVRAKDETKRIAVKPAR